MGQCIQHSLLLAEDKAEPSRNPKSGTGKEEQGLARRMAILKKYNGLGSLCQVVPD
jgi:hypothetical protein